MARALIAEDDVITGRELSKLVSDCGHDVVGVALSVDEALGVLKDGPVDVALLDIGLQGDQDGVDLALAITKTSKTRIIFVTSHADSQTIDRAAAASPRSYVLKPFRPESVEAALTIALAEHDPGRALRDKLPERFERVLEHIETNLDGDLSIDTLARIACFSPFHFSRKFKDLLGSPPRDFIAQRRVHRSKTMLEETAKPISEIAAACGFASQSHFTTVFGTFVGQTPAAYRRSLR